MCFAVEKLGIVLKSEAQAGFRAIARSTKSHTQRRDLLSAGTAKQVMTALGPVDAEVQ